MNCYNKYFINRHVFHYVEYDHGRKTYNSGIYVERLISNEFEIDYYKKL